MGVWIKGDKSGALLNVQLESPREHMHAYSEHYVKLDFSGWRYFELHFKERDSEHHVDYVWPYSYMHAIYRTPLNRKYLSAVNLYLNGIPAGEVQRLLFHLSRALPVKDEQIANPSININGELLTLPLVLNSGDFAEVYPDKTCIRFNAAGNPQERVEFGRVPELKSGINRFELQADLLTKTIPRAEVTSIIRGASFGKETRLLR